MRTRSTYITALTGLWALSLLGCSSDDPGKQDGPSPEVPPDIVKPELVPTSHDGSLPPDSRDTLLLPIDTAPGPETGRADVAVDGVALDGGALDGGPGIDANGAGAGIDAASSAVQRIIDPQIPQADSDTLALDNAAFAFAAYQKLAASAGNLVFSPASISIALAMTYAGAAGTTATEMAQALHFTLPPARLFPAFNALDQALASRGEGKLGTDGGPMRVRIVNSLWAEQTSSFRPQFLDLLAANYGAPVYVVDFVNAPEPARQSINAWVADMTEDKIQELLPEDSIDEATRLVLTNAVYLNALWKTPFYSGFDGMFTLLDGSTVTVKRMDNDTLTVPVVQSTAYKAVSLPYADDRLSLVVVLPEAGQFAQVESTLDAAGLANAVAGMTSKRVSMRMPKFKIETTTKLKDMLAELGMKAAFLPDQADFSGMTGGRDLYIGGAYHKAFIAVGEKGTEAAAATAVVMKDASMPMVDLYFTVDRPFLYYLRDNPTGAILFMGRVLDPR